MVEQTLVEVWWNCGLVVCGWFSCPVWRSALARWEIGFIKWRAIAPRLIKAVRITRPEQIDQIFLGPRFFCYELKQQISRRFSPEEPQQGIASFGTQNRWYIDWNNTVKLQYLTSKKDTRFYVVNREDILFKTENEWRQSRKAFEDDFLKRDMNIVAVYYENLRFLLAWSGDCLVKTFLWFLILIFSPLGELW